MTSTVEQVKTRLSIAEVVSGYLKLERAGANYRARCPFHQEKTPSFFVSPGRGTWHCFGCNRGGDLISFVQEIENLDFVGTLKLLAERAGVRYHLPDPKLASIKDRLYVLHEAAVRYYVEQLIAPSAARVYLKERGLTEETIKSFRLGWAPAGWRNIGPVLGRQGFKESELIQAGLLISPSGKSPYDRFRSRLMFPLADTIGRIVGFSGRIFDPPARPAVGQATGHDDGQPRPKYLNSSDTPLYDKSKLLYLYDCARLAMRAADRCILVEGQMDALLSHQTGLAETVAVSGTALSRDHLALIKRLTNNLIMAFDADLAGVNAGKRAIELALGLGFEVKIAVLPVGRDPADLIRDNPESWRRAADEAVHIIDFLLTVLKRQWLVRGDALGSDRRALAHAIEQEVYPFISQLANSLDQAFFINQIAVLLGLPENVIRDGVGKVKIKVGDHRRREAAESRESKVPATRRERLEEIIFGLVFWRGEFKTAVAERLDQERFEKTRLALEPRRDELMLAAEVAYAESTRLDKELEDLLDYWQEEVWREELAALLAKIKQLHGLPSETVTPFLARCQELSEKINRLKNHEQEICK